MRRIMLMGKPILAGLAALMSFAGIAEAQNAPERGGPYGSTVMGPLRPVRPGRHVAMPVVRDPASVVIRLTRSGCFGTCPSYSVELRGTGEIRFKGEIYVLVRGEHRASIAPDRVQALLQQFRRQDFWSLRAEYVADITDNASYRLTVTIDGVSKTVDDYVGRAVGMPAAVTALEEAVDRVSGVDRWVLGNDETLPGLRAEGWDFRGSEAAATLARASAEASDAIAFGLIDAGAPVTGGAITDYGGNASALENAATRARLALARRLIAGGAAAAQADRDAALFAAVASGHPAMVAEILKLGPAINAVNGDGDTPLTWVESGPHPFYDKPELTDAPGVIRMLIAAGADLRHVDRFGNTVLHDAVDPENAAAYIAGGAAIEARNQDGETPVLSSFSEDVVLVLIAAGADVNARANDGTTLRARAQRMKWNWVLAKLDGR